MPLPAPPTKRHLLLGIVVLSTLIFYLWTAASSRFDLSPAGPSDDYYSRLTDALLAGQLNLQIEPHPALLALPNPYDAAANAPYRVHDASLYQGKYYLYFGIGPVLSLLLPFKLLTGTHLPQALTILIFTGVGYLAATALWCRLRADYFKSAPPYADALGALMLGLATYAPLLLRRSMVYEVAVAGGYCWTLLTLHGTYRVLQDSQRRLCWLAWIGASGGCAVACRPNLAPGISLVILMVAIHAWRRASSLRERLGALSALGAPYAAWAAGLLLYNFLRFDNPLEFGVKYALTGYDSTRWQAFSLRYLPTSLAHHLFSPIGLSGYFPFIYPAGLEPRYAAQGYMLTEAVIGILPALPLVWLAPAAGWLAWRERHRRGLSRFVLICLLLGLTNLGIHGCFGATTARYQVDFLPPLLLASGAVGLFALSSSRSSVLRTIVSGLFVYSAAFGLLFSIQYLDLLKSLNPAVYRAAAMLLNRPVAAWELHQGAAYGPLRLQVTLPDAVIPGAHETLLHTGRKGVSNVIYIHYLAGNQARVGLFRSGSGGPLSEPFPITPGAQAEILIHHGSLLPPFGHPALAALSLDEEERLRGQVEVCWDGRPVLQASLPAHEATAFTRAIARNQQPPGPYADFSGRLISAAIQPWRPEDEALPAPDRRPGTVELDLIFPLERSHTKDPLVAIASDRPILLFVQYQPDRRVRFGLSRPGYDEVLTGPVEIDFLRPHRLEFSTEALHPAGTTDFNRVELKLDGVLLLSFDLGTSVNRREPMVHYGRNPAGVPGVAPLFFGRILNVARPPRSAPPERPEDVPIGPVIIASDFPLAMIGQAEPLVVTGRTGQGDFVYIRYLDQNHVAFGYDHWGHGGTQGDPIRVDYGDMHRLEISLGSLFPAPHIPATVDSAEVKNLRETVQVKLDGQVVFSAPAKPFDCGPGEIYFARNPLGGSSCRDRFTGRIGYIKRQPWP